MFQGPFLTKIEVYLTLCFQGPFLTKIEVDLTLCFQGPFLTKIEVDLTLCFRGRFPDAVIAGRIQYILPWDRLLRGLVDLFSLC